MAPLQIRAVGRGARRGQQHLPLDHVEFDVDAAGLLQILLQELVHRQRQHLARAGSRDHHLERERLCRRVAGFGQQRLALGGVELVAIDRRAEIGIAGLEPADRRLRRAVEQRDQPFPIDAIVQRLAHSDVLERAVGRAML